MKPLDHVYEKNARIYNKLKEYENNPDEWIKATNEIDDPKVVITFFEWYLAKDSNATNKKIWTAYMKFLGECDMKVSKQKLSYF